jgi:hypothetical protein
MMRALLGKVDWPVMVLMHLAHHSSHRGDTIIVPVLHPGTAIEIFDNIPDNLAYTLSNTVTFDFIHKKNMAILDIDANVTAFIQMIQNFVTPEKCPQPTLSGIWHVQTLLRGDTNLDREVFREFALLIDHKEDGSISVETVNGKLDAGRSRKCRRENETFATGIYEHIFLILAS